jgi:hypothetical protein
MDEIKISGNRDLMMKIAMLRNEKKTIAGSGGPLQFFSVSEILVYTI